MNNERRYSEKEIAAIFERAAGAQEDAGRHALRGEGLTLAELQQIGSDVGISPEFIARAAASVGGGSSEPAPTTFLGIPISVSRTQDLPAPLSDEDWERVVVDLRETFRARGDLRSDGSLREWWNGNLHALVEPTDSGHRLRLGTLKGSASTMVGMSILFFIMGLVFLTVAAVTGKIAADPESTLFLSLFAVGGLTSLGIVRYRLRQWVEERGRQMEAVSARAVELVAVRNEKADLDAAATPRLDMDEPEDRADRAPSRTADRTRS